MEPSWKNTPFSWKVKNFDSNLQKIINYDLLASREGLIKNLKKSCLDRDSFAQALEREFRYRFWCRSEYELLITKTFDNKILLSPWCGCRDVDAATKDVTYDATFDWNTFYAEQLGTQANKSLKIDIWDQINFNWEAFLDFCWRYQHKYQRNPK